MDRQPLISVIIPTYNRPDFLCELMESLWRQTYRQLQIIIVNDCGESVDFVKDLYPELDITVVHLESNQKHVHARNKGLEFVRGEYIMLCDDDDLLLPGHVERMLQELEDSDLVYSDVEIFDYVVDEAGVRWPTNRFVFAYEYDAAGMRRFSTFFSSGCLYRKTLQDRLAYSIRRCIIIGIGIFICGRRSIIGSKGCRWPARCMLLHKAAAAICQGIWRICARFWTSCRPSTDWENCRPKTFFSAVGGAGDEGAKGSYGNTVGREADRVQAGRQAKGGITTYAGDE